MSAEKKLEIIRPVESSGLPRDITVAHFNVPIRTYYRWLRKFKDCGKAGLYDKTPFRGKSWNQLLDAEIEKVMEVSLLYPEWSSREVSCHITDSYGFSVSESSVYRLLKKAGLIKETEIKTFPAGPELQLRRIAPASSGRPMLLTCW